MHNIKIPEELKYIINTLESAGYEAYAVGGCVRDSLLGKDPVDWDVCTSAVPEQALKLFKNHQIIETGLRHGTVTLMLNHSPFEITTYRTDGIYTDNRRPDSVEFVKSLREDLARRDFTINAMAYNPREGVADFFGGEEDLENKIIRCVGDADKRFKEDALRIMRALRFSSTLEFSIETNTSAAIRANKELLNNIAAERIAVELNKLVLGTKASSVMSDYATVISEIIPEIIDMIGFEQNNPHHCLDVWKHTLKCVENAPVDVILRLTMLFHDIGKPVCYTEADAAGHFYSHPQVSSDMAKIILKRLKYDNNTINQVSELILYHDYKIKPNNKDIKRLLNKIGEKKFRQLIEVQTADAKAKSFYSKQKKIRALDKLSSLLDEIIESRQCYSLENLAVNGKDLISAGLAEGKVVGIILHRLLEMVIEGKAENNKEILLKETEKFMREQ